jgi:hypothetical protein
MATFAIGKPVTTTQPTIVVDAGLPAGTHRFQLEVVAKDGRTSAPSLAEVKVARGTGPVLDPTRRIDVVVPVSPLSPVSPVSPPPPVVVPVRPVTPVVRRRRPSKKPKE